MLTSEATLTVWAKTLQNEEWERLSNTLIWVYGYNAKTALSYLKTWCITRKIELPRSEPELLLYFKEVSQTKQLSEKGPKHQCIQSPTQHIAFHIATGTYFMFDGKAWELDNVTQKQAIKYATTKITDKDELKCVTEDHTYAVKNFKTMNFAPNKPIEYKDNNDNLILNTWVKPAIEFAPGTFPSINKIVQRLVNYDEASEHYWTHWLAFKVQHPEMINGNAIAFVGAHGTGKSTLMSVVKDILGRDNCYTIDQASLTKPYNSHFAAKCFINANEIEAPKRDPDALASKLKEYIADSCVEVEAKGSNRYTIENHSSWVFTTNHNDALFVESGDRRYTIFEDGIVGQETPPEHKFMIDSLWVLNNTTDEFKEEIAHYGYYLKHLEVDTALIRNPLRTQAKIDAVDASKPTTIDFIDELELRGLKALAVDIPELQSVTLIEKEGYVVGAVIYKCFQKWCENNKSSNVFIPSSKRLFRDMKAKYPKAHKMVGIVFYNIPLESRLKAVI